MKQTDCPDDVLCVHVCAEEEEEEEEEEGGDELWAQLQAVSLSDMWAEEWVEEVG